MNFSLDSQGQYPKCIFPNGYDKPWKTVYSKKEEDEAMAIKPGGIIAPEENELKNLETKEEETMPKRVFRRRRSLT